ncbi:hypothetical protein [Dyadobacter sandarakinus]|uniref:PhoU domain-containing protein n=1 Tax=Dyadobacter sandarakinus TaxID=2747268 RepID=A0ABX7I640_9BACT|nr:hypothetical protein [Dyadobacter sandarakinus]QRR00648.1 hypothetical protein HWI92_06865 [Dyadobacter sandarakinus]
MSIELAKEELALADLNATRSYLDEISYNIRDLFYGENTDLQEHKPVDIAENLIVALDIFTYTLEKITQLERHERDLPKINSILLSVKSILTNARSVAAIVQTEISDAYHQMLLDSLDGLEETVEDLEEIFFVLPHDKRFMAAANRLLWAK